MAAAVFGGTGEGELLGVKAVMRKLSRGVVRRGGRASSTKLSVVGAAALKAAARSKGKGERWSLAACRCRCLHSRLFDPPPPIHQRPPPLAYVPTSFLLLRWQRLERRLHACPGGAAAGLDCAGDAEAAPSAAALGPHPQGQWRHCWLKAHLNS